MRFVAPDLVEGSRAWTLIEAQCAEIVKTRPGLARPEYRASLIDLAIQQCAHKFLPRRK